MSKKLTVSLPDYVTVEVESARVYGEHNELEYDVVSVDGGEGEPRLLWDDAYEYLDGKGLWGQLNDAIRELLK